MHQASRINITCNHLGTLDKFEPGRSYGAKFTFYFLPLYLENEDFMISIKELEETLLYIDGGWEVGLHGGLRLRITS